MQAKHEENLQALLAETRQNLEWLSAVSIVPEDRKRPAEAVQVCGPATPSFPTISNHVVFFWFTTGLLIFLGFKSPARLARKTHFQVFHIVQTL
jgi:hypothetical protein